MKAGLLDSRRVIWLIAAVYLAAMFVSPPGPPDMPGQERDHGLIGLPVNVLGDGIRYLQLTRAIAEHRRLYVFDGVSSIDYNADYAVGLGGRVYIPHAPGLSVLAVPFYLLLGVPGLYLLMAILGVATCWLVFLTCRRHSSELTAARITLFFGLGSALFTYSEAFYSEVLSAALVIASFYCLLAYEENGLKSRLLLSGLLAGLMPSTKPPLALVAALFFLYAAWRRGLKSSIVFALGFSATFSTFLLYNLLCFGSPFKTAWDSILLPGDANLTGFTSPLQWGGNPVWNIPVLTLVMFLSQPILLASAAGLARNRAGPYALVSAAYIVLAIFYGIRTDSVGGWCWSWRYMVPFIPMLALPAAAAYEGGIAPKKLFWALFYISLMLALLSLSPQAWHLQTWAVNAAQRAL